MEVVAVSVVRVIARHAVDNASAALAVVVATLGHVSAGVLARPLHEQATRRALGAGVVLHVIAAARRQVGPQTLGRGARCGRHRGEEQ